MRVSEVVIVPSVSREGQGRLFGKFSEFDVVNGYVTTLCENLEEDRVNFRVLREGENIYPNSLVLYCSSGFLEKKSKSERNCTIVNYKTPSSVPFAETVVEALSDWGKCYVDYKHKASNPIKLDGHNILNEAAAVENTIAISVQPFHINGPNSGEYMKRLPSLGKILSTCVYDFLLSRGEHPKMMRLGS